MKKFSITSAAFLFFLVSSLSSCQAIGDIFKAGIWVGVIGVAIVVFIIIYFIGKSRN